MTVSNNPNSYQETIIRNGNFVYKKDLRKPEHPVPLKLLSDSNDTLSFSTDATPQDAFKIELVHAPEAPKVKWNEKKPIVIVQLANAEHQCIADAEEFTGEPGSVLKISGIGAYIGVGPKKDDGTLSAETTKSIAKAVSTLTKRLTYKNVALIAKMKFDVNKFVSSLLIASFEADSYKTVKSKGITAKTFYLNEFGLEGSKSFDISIAKQYALPVVRCRELTEAPPSHCSPRAFADVAKSVADKLDGVAYTELSWEQCRDMGMNSYTAVSQGMTNQPVFVHITYKNGKPKHRLALVGKGVCHDTGGYNIKSFSSRMHDMMTDMGGAAITLCSFELLVSQSPKDVEIHAIIPCVENLINADAYLPGDYIQAMNGLSIAVLNTDAEGRLILNDGICYAQKIFSESEDADSNTDIKKTILTSATLTGAQLVALSDECAAYFSTKEEYAAKIKAATKTNWENAWELPLLECLEKRLDHPRADCTNLGMPVGQAGTITPALFLKKFITMENVEFIHFDVAGPVFDMRDGTGTGYGPWLYRDFLTDIMDI